MDIKQHIVERKENLPQLNSTIEHLFLKGLQGSKNTKKAYESDLKQFFKYCSNHGLETQPIAPLTAAHYIAFLSQSCKVSTIQRKLASLSKYQKLNGYDSFMSNEVQIVMEGLKREKGVVKKQAPSFDKETLKKVIYALDTSKAKQARDKALILLGFTGAFRRAELVGLNVEDLEFTSDCLLVHLRGSKTNQHQEQETKAIFYSSDPLMCPIRSINHWLKNFHFKHHEALFTSFRRGNTILSQRLSVRAVNQLIGDYFSKAFSPHSLRTSFVTISKLNGAQDSEIMQQTGHKTTSMIRCYTRIVDVTTHNAAMKLGL